MSQIFILVYFIFFVVIAVTSLFISYHISRYSLSDQNARFGKITYFGGLAALLLLNLVLFSSVDWRSLDFQIQPIPPVQSNVW